VVERVKKLGEAHSRRKEIPSFKAKSTDDGKSEEVGSTSLSVHGKKGAETVTRKKDTVKV